MKSNTLLRVAVLGVLAAAIVAGAYWMRRDDTEAPPQAAVPTPQPVRATITMPAMPPAAPQAEAAAPCKGSLLSQEPLLTRNGIALLMGHSTGDSGVRLAKSCRPEQVDALFALSAVGMKPLQLDPSTANSTVPWGCAKELPSFGTRAPQILERDDLLVANGKQVPTVLQWTPAVQSEASAECQAPRLDFQSEEQRLFEIKGSTNRWLVETWRPPVDPLEVQQDAGIKPVQRVFVLSRVTAPNQCAPQDSGEATDVGGAPPTHNASRYRRVYGVLEAKDAQGEKSWMILESGTDEARGIVAIEMDAAKGQLQTRQREALFYSGC